MFPLHIEQAINTYNEIGQDNHITHAVTTIAKRENVSIPRARKIYEDICEKIGNKNTQDVYAVLGLANRKPVVIPKDKENQNQLDKILKTVRTIKAQHEHDAIQIEYIIYIMASFHPEPLLRKFANTKLKEITEYLDTMLPGEDIGKLWKSRPSSDVLFISQMFYELAQTFEKAASNRTDAS